MHSFEDDLEDLEVEGLEVEGFGAAVIPLKREVIIAQSMVKGERSNQRKEIKSPPGKLTYNRYKLQSDGGQNENSLNSQRCLLSAGPAR